MPKSAELGRTAQNPSDDWDMMRLVAARLDISCLVVVGPDWIVMELARARSSRGLRRRLGAEWKAAENRWRMLAHVADGKSLQIAYLRGLSGSRGF